MRGIVAEYSWISTRLADKPSKHYVCDALDAMQHIVRTEGIKGLYRGLWPNLREWPDGSPWGIF